MRFLFTFGAEQNQMKGESLGIDVNDSAVTVLPEHCLLAESFSFIFLCSAVWLTFTDSPDSPTMW